MAYDIFKDRGKYKVITQRGQKILGTHDTRHEAEAQMRAIEIHENYRTQPTPGTLAPDGKSVLNDSYEPVPITKTFVDGRTVLPKE